MSFLLDTNVVSELRRADRANAGLLAWAEGQPVGGMFLSAISVLELEIGVMRMERRDAVQGRALQRWLEEVVMARFAGRILVVDADVARRCAALHTPDPRPERDALIAATALVHGLSVVTRNVGDFAPLGVRVVNPWG